MKIITKEQIDAIIQAFFEVNAPIKLYASVKEMLEKLPESPVTTEEVTKKQEEGVDNLG
jgi:hypothetical protein